MSSPHSIDARIRNGGPREVLTTSLMGICLMMLLTIWWWYAMR